MSYAVRNDGISQFFFEVVVAGVSQLGKQDLVPDILTAVLSEYALVRELLQDYLPLSNPPLHFVIK